MVSKLKQVRQANQITQQEAADLLRVSVRSYKTYENDPAKENTMKYQYMVEQIEKLNYVDEDHGILGIEEISRICREVFKKYPVDYCYLFGSYVREDVRENSDIDLFISTELTGLKYYGLVEELREGLRKRVDPVTLQQSGDNLELLDEVFREGIKIYARA